MRSPSAATCRALSMVLAIAAAGCAAGGIPIQGKLLQSDETFSGTASEPAEGKGTVTLKSSRGTKCSGNYSYFELGEELKKLGGLMDFTCEDGRKGGVILNNDKSKLRGVGTMGDDVFLLGE